MKDFAKSIRTGNAYIKKNTDGTSEITKGWFSGTKLDDSNKNTILKKAEDMARIEKETEIEIEKIQKEYDESKGVTFYDGEYIGTDAIGGLVVKKGHLAGKYTRGAFQGRLNTQKKYNEQNKREWNGLLEELKKVGNSKVGNGSGSWRGKFYEDSAGNSASLEKRGEGWEVYWEDYKGYGKPLGTYKDEKTAREVAEAAVESEMPDRIRATYKSKALNSKVGNADIYSGNYIIMSDDGNVWFRDEHDDVSIKNIDSWSNERIRQYQASIDEIKKGVQEAKQAAKKYGLL